MYPHIFLFRFHNILVSHQVVPLTFYNKIAPMAVSNQKWCNGHCFTATCENKKIHYGAFLFLTLLSRLTELSKVFQAGCFNVAQMKASVELCTAKLSDAAAKTQLKADWERITNYGNLERWMVLVTRVCQGAWRFARAPKGWRTDHPNTEKGDRSECTNYWGISLLSLHGKCAPSAL